MINAAWGEIPDRENHIVCSPSALMAFRKDPEIYKLRYIDKKDEPTASMEFGSMVHKYVLEPDLFAEQYYIQPLKTAEVDYDSERLKAMCKEFGEKVTGTKRELAARLRNHIPDFQIYEEIIDSLSCGNKKPVSPDIAQKLVDIRIKIMSHEKVGSWIHLAEKEKKGYLTHSSGVVMPFVADAFLMHKNVGICMDLKITTHFEPNKFMRNIFESGYHMQAAAYCEAISAIEGQTFENFLFITIEPVAPHRIRYLQLDSAALDAGKLELNKYMIEFRKRFEHKNWGPRQKDNEIQQVSLASWDWEKISEVE
jgi:hypothetical protein